VIRKLSFKIKKSDKTVVAYMCGKLNSFIVVSIQLSIIFVGSI